MKSPVGLRDWQIRRIAVFGLGKLGACIAATLASRGFQVIGFDVDPRKTDAVSKGIAPIEEPNLQATIDRAGSRLKATNDVREAIAQADASFFIPSTPSLPDGSFSNQYIIPAITSAAEAARQHNKEFHLFVVNSTVTPGTCDRVLIPMIEEILGGERGERFGMCYNPEFIALGDVVRGLLEPDFVLIGESDEASGAALEQVYRSFCTNAPAVERMSNINAELAKISVNCAVTTKISFVNQLSAVCAKIPGADPRVILRSIGKDHRIGPEYLKPGLGFGGPCFPRDNELFQYVARSVGVEATLALATVEVNEDVNQRLLETVLSHCQDGCSVGILGLAYKPFTNVIDCSPGIWLCRMLAEQDRKVLAHDYLAGANSTSVLRSDGRVEVCEDPQKVLDSGCQTLVITCPWPAYREFFASRGPEMLRPGTVVVDPWSLLEGVVPQLRDVRYITSLSSSGAATLPRLAAHV